MRRLFAMAIAVLGGCVFPLPDARAPGIPVPITFTQQSSNFSSAGGALSVTLPGPSTAGDGLLVGAMWKPSSAPHPSLSDNQGDSFQVLVPGVGNDTVGVAELSFAPLPTPGAGPIVLSLSGSGATYLEMACVEYAGIEPNAPLDASTDVINASSSQTVDAQLLTTASGDLLVGWAVSAKRVDPGPGFRQRADVNGDLLEDGDAPDAGTWTVTGAGNDPSWLLVAAALRAQRH